MITSPTENELGELLSYLTPQEKDELDRLLRPNHHENAVTLQDLRIRTKNRELVPLSPNVVQARYLDLILPNWRRGDFKMRGLREDVLKARQEGMSTIILALMFLDTINTPRTHSLIVAHDSESTERLFLIVHRFWENLPVAKRRPTKYSSKRELVFADIDSVIYVGTAGTATLGRGSTINNLHESEYAFWPSTEVEIGLLEAVTPEGNVFRETTANGLGEYHEERQREKRGESRFTPRFFPWHIFPDYVEDPAPSFTRTEDEQRIAEAYSLTDAQLQWRRTKRTDLGESFPQEYPSNEAEAFLASGNPYFDRTFLAGLVDRLQAPEHDPIRTILPGEGMDCRTEIYAEPVEGRKYIVTADPAEGLDGAGDHDFACGGVWDMDAWEEVAVCEGRVGPHAFAGDCVALASYYNGAEIVPMRMNHGHAMIEALIFTHDYPNIYYHQEYDERTKSYTEKRPGYPETTRTKAHLDDTLSGVIDEMARGLGGLTLHSRRGVEQLTTYVKKPGGGAGGEGTAHDDHVTRIKLAVQRLRSGPDPNRLRRLQPRDPQAVAGGR